MFEIELLKDSTVVASGRLDATQANKAEGVLDQLQGNSVIDCRKLDYISSAGIGVVLATYKRLSDKGYALRMVNASDHIRQVFRYAGLEQLLMG